MALSIEGSKNPAFMLLQEEAQKSTSNRLIEKIKQIVSVLFTWITSVFTYFQSKESPSPIVQEVQIPRRPPTPPPIPDLPPSSPSAQEDSFPPLAGEDPPLETPSSAARSGLARRQSMDGQFPLIPCKEEEQKIIEYIFSTVSAGGPELLLKATTLRAEEKKIVHLHPFTLLAHVKPKYIQGIWSSLISKKKTDLMDGITRSMFRDHQLNRLACHVDHFAIKMKKDPKVIMGLLAKQNWHPGKQDWTEFMKYLFDLK